MNRFSVFFLEPKSVGEDDRRREYILNVVLVGSIVMLVFFGALILYYSLTEGVNYNGVSFATLLCTFAFSVFLFILSRCGFFGLISYLLVVAYLLGDVYAAYQWGIDLHIVVLGYALIVLLASILIGTWFGFLMAGIIIAAIIPLRYLQLSGIIPLQSSADDIIDAVALAAIISFIVIIAWLWNRELEKSLLRAKKSESELKEERDSLEIQVVKRTQALQQMQFEKVEQLYRFAEFGQLASGLFHDLLNLVNAASLADAVKVPAQQASTISQRIEDFVQAIKRQLDHHETQKFFSLAEGVEYVLRLLSYKAMRAEIRIDFFQKGDRELVCFGDIFKFHQIVMNLVMNALDSYETSTRGAGERVVEINIQKWENVIALKIADNGCGIPEAIRAKIFEPFFTTKTGAKGTGIGLATTKKIAEQDFHGTISLESEEGKGSAFTVLLPIKTK
jgi:signal transduction histidine kinase